MEEGLVTDLDAKKWPDAQTDDASSFYKVGKPYFLSYIKWKIYQYTHTNINKSLLAIKHVKFSSCVIVIGKVEIVCLKILPEKIQMLCS